jgi:uroporphyrinogen-III decarboxylase
VEKQWSEMTPEEKRTKRLEPYLNPTKIKFKDSKAAQLYKERINRLLKMYMNQVPDRVPVSLPAGNFPLYHNGGDLKRGMYDYKFLRQSYSKFLQDFKEYADTMPGPSLTLYAPAMEMLDMKFMKWPGYGLKDNVTTYQFVEGEYMKADEYDHLLRDPSDFAFRVQMPRLYGVAKPFAKMNPYAMLLGMNKGFINPFMDAEIANAYQTLIDAGKENMKWANEISIYNQEVQAEGFPVLRGGMSMAPFDFIGDSLRGTQGVMLDMYRQPDKLLAAIDAITPIVIKHGIDSCNANGGVMMHFPLHKGDDTFMSDKQFEKFYWPSLKKYADALIAEGIMPNMFAEGKYSRRLNYISDFPKGWMHWIFDQTDMVKAKQLVGPNCSLSGNIPTSVMCTAKPKQVKEYCRKLIETCGPGGGYMLAGGASATETNTDNLKVLMEAAIEYGKY